MRIELHIEGYDYCYTGLETEISYLVSKYIVNDIHGEMMPITKWTIETEWITKKQISRLKNLELLLDI